MKVAEKLDWLEYAVLYTKNKGIIRCDSDDLDEIQVHKLQFGDRLIAALLRDPSFDQKENEKLIKRFCEWVLPDEYHKYYNFENVSLQPRTVSGYAFTIRIGDDDSWFYIRVPMHEITEYEKGHNCYCVESARTGALMSYNAFVGYKICITGSNMPCERIMLREDYKQGTIYPVRFDVENWCVKLQQYNTLVKLSRVDIALDIAYDFNQFAKLWQEDPRRFKVPYFKSNCRLDYNPYTGAGAICCGKRGSANDSYLRIYNKAAEQGDIVDFYPWDDYYADLAYPNCINGLAGKFQEVPWTRFEFELRGNTAIHFLGDYFDKVMDDDTAGHFVFDYVGLFEIETDQEKKYADISKYCRLNFSSLWESVIKCYNLYAKRANEYFVQFREEIHANSFSIQSASLRFHYRATPYRTGLRLLKSVNRSYQAMDIYKNGDADSLKRISDILSQGDDIVELISLIPLDFADAATRQRLLDISHCCQISKHKAAEMLNEASLKGYFNHVVEKVQKLKKESIEKDDYVDDEEYQYNEFLLMS